MGWRSRFGRRTAGGLAAVVIAAAGFWAAATMAGVNPGQTLTITGSTTSAWTWSSPYYLSDACQANPGPAYTRYFYAVTGLYDPTSLLWQYADVPGGQGQVTASCSQQTGPTYNYGTGLYDYTGTNTWTASASYSIPSSAAPGQAYKTALIFDCNNPYCTVGGSVVDIVNSPTTATTTVSSTTTVGSTTTVAQTTTQQQTTTVSQTVAQTTTQQATTTVAQTTTVVTPLPPPPPVTTVKTTTPAVKNRRPTLAWLSISAARRHSTLRVRMCDDTQVGLMTLHVSSRATRAAVTRSLVRRYAEVNGCRSARISWTVPRVFATHGFTVRAQLRDRTGAASAPVVIHLRAWETTGA